MTGIDIPPLVILVVGIATVIGLILALRTNAFLALIIAAMLVSLMAPGDIEMKIKRVAMAFGTAAGNIGIVIALAAIIGQCMMESGAADRIVRSFLSALGQKRAGFALMSSGYVLAIPVFFDTVFYLLVPLARSLYRRTRKDYVLYIMAIAAGGAVTHSLVPPTPGPLLMADTLKVDLGVMILVGALIAFPTSVVGLIAGGIMNRRRPIAMSEVAGDDSPRDPTESPQTPGLLVSLLPIVLPVILISLNTGFATLTKAPNEHTTKQADIAKEADQLAKYIAVATGDSTEQSTLARETSASVQKTLDDTMKGALHHAAITGHQAERSLTKLAEVDIDAEAKKKATDLASRQAELNLKLNEMARHPVVHWAADMAKVIGDPNFALFVSAIISMGLLVWVKRLSLRQLEVSVEKALMSGGIIILITAAGGAFGAMLKEAQIGPAIEAQFGETKVTGLLLLTLGFAVAAVMKVAQGSGTVSMITTSGMLAAMVPSSAGLGFDPVYLATAIGAGSMCGSWMNDSGFWVVSKMSGLTEMETLRTWTILLIILGITAYILSMLAAVMIPYPLGAPG